MVMLWLCSGITAAHFPGRRRLFCLDVLAGRGIERATCYHGWCTPCVYAASACAALTQLGVVSVVPVLRACGAPDEVVFGLACVCSVMLSDRLIMT